MVAERAEAKSACEEASGQGAQSHANVGLRWVLELLLGSLNQRLVLRLGQERCHSRMVGRVSLGSGCVPTDVDVHLVVVCWVLKDAAAICVVLHRGGLDDFKYSDPVSEGPVLGKLREEQTSGSYEERGETSGVSKVFLRIARKSILFEQKT